MRSRSCAIRQFLPEVLSIFAIEARQEGESLGAGVRDALCEAGSHLAGHGEVQLQNHGVAQVTLELSGGSLQRNGKPQMNTNQKGRDDQDLCRTDL